MKPRRGRQRKMWGRGWMELYSSSKSFLACADECVSERESKALRKALDIKTLHIYMYVQEVC